MVYTKYENAVIVPGQLLGSRFLEYQRRMTTKSNWGNKIIAVITRV